MLLRILTLGDIRVFVGETELPTLPTQRLRCALLVYLGVERAATREQLMSLFWPERDAERARHSLNQTLYELRQVLGSDWVDAQGEQLRVTRALELDALLFEQRVARGDYTAALELYRGSFLAGMYLADTQPFETWVDRQQVRFTRLHRKARRELLNARVAEGDMAGALVAARQWVDVEPLEDEAQHRLMELLAGSGQRAEALHQFETYERLLRANELEPLEETVALVARIRAGEVAAPQPALARAPAPASAAARTEPVASAPEERLEPEPDADAEETEPSSSPWSRFLGELMRRKVSRVAISYAIVAFVVLQAADVLFPALLLPEWGIRLLTVLLLLGFPIALMLAWAFDITPAGVRRARPLRRRALAMEATVAAVPRSRWRMWAESALGVGALVLIIMVAVNVRDWRIQRTAPQIDEQMYAILPFANSHERPPGQLDGELAARLLRASFARWRDIKTADALRTNDILQQHNAANVGRIGVDSGVAMARSLGAGRVVMGEVWWLGDTARISATLYEVRSRIGRALQSAQILVPEGTPDPARFDSLADRLLLPDGHMGPTAGGARLTSSFTALLAYQQGERALRAWRLDDAVEHFRAAAHRDSTFAYAHLQLAQVLTWAGDTSGVFRESARHAATFRAQLPALEKVLAEAYEALANRSYDAACARFRAALKMDSLNWPAWYGLGECQTRDPVVLPDPKSPSQWRFRGSYHAGLEAYRRAFHIAPSFTAVFGDAAAMRRLRRLFHVEPFWFRWGPPLTTDTLVLWAFPGLVADTLSFVPFPREDVRAGKAGTLPVTRSAAVARNRQILQELVVRAARAVPRNASVHEALAMTLESVGDLAEATVTEHSALAAARTARSLARDPEQQLRLAVLEVRLLLKMEQFTRARALADSTLRRWSSPNPEQAESLAGLAALLGRVHDSARLYALAAPDPVASAGSGPIPLPLRRSVGSLLTYAGFGVPLDSARVLRQRVGRLIDAWVTAAQRDEIKTRLLEHPMALAFPELGLSQAHRPGAQNHIIAMQLALAAGDTAAVQRQLAAVDSMRHYSVQPGSVSAEAIYPELRVRLAIGDTAGTIYQLDRFVNALSAQRSDMLDRPSDVGSLVRAMALRAELAGAKGQAESARRWAQVVLTLWANADEELKPVVGRMRQLAGRTD